METKTYESMQDFEKFSQEQNIMNEKLAKRIKILELQNSLLSRQIQEMQAELIKLKETQVKNILKLSRCQAELEILKNEDKSNLKQELDRLKLTAKLNSNAIERLTRNKDE
ncbi:MAG: hypothetical protein K2G88_04700 [Oscillospiraceae bacterium]|nr:hypothetical protein [Oscillospiraceae bacterium]MDE6004665.1 hypothetical protein [Oscillospiraceae bacterium]MDE6657386.1 hypothetical protein [Oscillospiraceae bacterium]